MKENRVEKKEEKKKSSIYWDGASLREVSVLYFQLFSLLSCEKFTEVRK